MFDGDESGDQPQDLGRSSLRLKQNFLVWDELLGRRSNGAVGSDGDFGKPDIRVWLVCEHDRARKEQQPELKKETWEAHRSCSVP